MKHDRPSECVFSASARAEITETANQAFQMLRAVYQPQGSKLVG